MSPETYENDVFQNKKLHTRKIEFNIHTTTKQKRNLEATLNC